MSGTYEDRVQIQTPEGVELELTLAGLGSRFMARMLDELLKYAVLFAVILLVLSLDAATSGPLGVASDDGSDFGALGIAIIVVLVFLAEFFYDVPFEIWANGRTPGKMAAGLRVVRTGGRPLGFLTSCIRNLLRIVDMLPFAYGVGMVSVLVSKHNQRLGDLAAGTLVIRDRKAADRAEAYVAAGGPPGWLHPTNQTPPAAVAGWDVSAVTGEDLATVSAFLARRYQLDPPARARLSEDIALRLWPRVAGAPTGMTPEAFLEHIAAAKALRSG